MKPKIIYNQRLPFFRWLDGMRPKT
jgi:hypothetical protein